MKAVCRVILLLALSVRAEESNPLGKVLELLGSLEAKIQKQGDEEAQAFKKFTEWCDDASRSTSFSIKTDDSKKKKLDAKIGEATSDIEVGTAKVEDLSSAISTAESELKDATAIREEEAADFRGSEKELMATVETLERAIGILEKEMAKGSAALTQIDTSSMQNVVKALDAIVDAAAFSTDDRQRLAALVQAHQEDHDDESELGAPAASKYESKSGGIVELLDDLKEKAENELADARKAEATAKHNYAMLKQSLTDKVEADTKDMDGEKAGVAAAKESKAVSSKDLAITEKDLSTSSAALETYRKDCMQTAADHDATVASRDEELGVLAKAKKMLQESTGGAEKDTYGFLQVAATSKATTRILSTNNKLVAMIKKMAFKQHSAALSQLASRISATVLYGESVGDPFTKVKQLLEGMINDLQKEAEEAATEKAYCDEETKKTEEKKAELQDGVDKLTSKIDKAASRSAELKEEVADLQAELASLAKIQAEADKVREASHADFVKAKSELTEGLSGVRKALGVLRDYYGGSAAAFMQQDDEDLGAFMQQPKPPVKHEKSSGAGGSIIDILEVTESDFAKNLAKEETEEADEANQFEEMTQQNKVTKSTKEQDVKFKNQEAAALDKSLSELSSDRETINTELSAVLEYSGKLKERCVAKPESYEVRKKKREEMIEGLKQGLEMLDAEGSFLQRRHKRRGHFLTSNP